MSRANFFGVRSKTIHAFTGVAALNNVRSWRVAMTSVTVAIDPGNPARLFAAMWERQRREDYIKYGGAGSALYLSTDAGGTWNVVMG